MASASEHLSPTAPEPELGDPREPLVRLGLACPEGVSWPRWLIALADAGGLEPATVAAYLALAQETRRPGSDLDPTAVGQVARRLAREVERLGGRTTEARQALADKAAGLAVAGPLDEPFSPLVYPRETSIMRPRERRWRRGLLASALVGWSLLMVALGYVQRHQIDAWRVERATEGRIAEGRLTEVRNAALSAPDSRQAWLNYARVAYLYPRHREAVVAYRYLLSLDPNDVAALNDLAWIYCTATVPELHDYAAALPLARRAYELNAAPDIGDTYALALFLNGQVDQAIEVQTQALAEAEAAGLENVPHFRQQLETFRTQSPP